MFNLNLIYFSESCLYSNGVWSFCYIFTVELCVLEIFCFLRAFLFFAVNVLANISKYQSFIIYAFIVFNNFFKPALESIQSHCGYPNTRGRNTFPKRPRERLIFQWTQKRLIFQWTHGFRTRLGPWNPDNDEK